MPVSQIEFGKSLFLIIKPHVQEYSFSVKTYKEGLPTSALNSYSVIYSQEPVNLK